MRIFVAGDIHGNFRYTATYLYPVAKQLGCDVVVQLGDYGFWEHEEDGVEFNDAIAGAALRFGIPFYFLRGNHDNLRLLTALYGSRVTDGGFISIRPNLFHIPDGLRWNWGGVSFRAFGGAYSMDKQDRINRELKRDRRHAQQNIERRRAGHPERDYRTAVGTEWFPEEELTDAQMHQFLAEDDWSADVVFSHDKPRSSSPGDWWRERPESVFNQDRLQRALLVHKPRLWVHGHLHHRYVDVVRCGDDGRRTMVTGISCDDVAKPRFGWRPEQSWSVLETDPLKLHLGDSEEIEIDYGKLQGLVDAAYDDDHDGGRHAA